jgi:hypothetical protein
MDPVDNGGGLAVADIGDRTGVLSHGLAPHRRRRLQEQLIEA